MKKLGQYTRVYPEVVKEVRHQLSIGSQIHGSTVREIFIRRASGRYVVDDHAEKLLTEMVESGELKYLQKAPTHSQATFIGLQFQPHTYRQLEWVPGIREHYWYAKTN